MTNILNTKIESMIINFQREGRTDVNTLAWDILTAVEESVGECISIEEHLEATQRIRAEYLGRYMAAETMITRMAKALRPFNDHINAIENYSTWPFGSVSVKMGDLRKARDVLREHNAAANDLTFKPDPQTGEKYVPGQPYNKSTPSNKQVENTMGALEQYVIIKETISSELTNGEFPKKYNVFLKVGGQQFNVTPLNCACLEEAEFMRDALCTALGKIVSAQLKYKF